MVGRNYIYTKNPSRSAMAVLLYTILMCTVAVVLSTPASNEKWKLMGKLLTDVSIVNVFFLFYLWE